MSAYRLSARSLHDRTHPEPSRLEEELARYLAYAGVGVGPGERASWRGSLPVLAQDLRDAGLEQVEVLIEHRLPLTSKRTDAILAGVHPRTKQPSYLVVELKQWSRARSWDGEHTLVDVQGAPYRPSLHPSVQVGGYRDYLRDFMGIFDDSALHLDGVAYLHNASDSGVAELWHQDVLQQAPMFTAERRGDFLEHLRSHFAETPGAGAADLWLRSKVAPSKKLLSVAADEIRDQEQFVLVGKQSLGYHLALRAVVRALSEDTKTAIVISGGPGSGKSVIALSLLGELARQGRSVLHATGSKSFTQTLRKVAGHRSRPTQALFKYFNQFMDAEKNGLEVLILDEAHRIRETSVNRYTPKQVRERARLQVDELIDAARVPVFLLDQNQVVRPGEAGSLELITDHVRDKGIAVRHVNLNAQFRAGGSQVYVDWLLRLLGLGHDPHRPGSGEPTAWPRDDRYALTTASSPQQLEAQILALDAGGDSARMTAGFCWPWSDPTPDGRLVPDVKIGEWARPWNVKSERRVGEAPPSHLWATEPGGISQVGCIYTAQGFEYDWNGVILGHDLVWRQDRWVAQREFSKDPAFRRSVPDDEFDRLVRNVYKVLLTRGMKGTILYSTDPETQAMLESVIGARGTGPDLAWPGTTTSSETAAR
ncbi:DNA/RNA helicase domain-containing protein [Pseudactinotalea sp. Z1732]|uniref:DNA/RNA helicase domain-containing protein n=1 Tax=Pseudactinotalea sp. Z1732 TaxID=3413026 RepID=UPI003C7CFC99